MSLDEARSEFRLLAGVARDYAPLTDRVWLWLEAKSLRLDCLMAARRPYCGPSAKLKNMPPADCSCAPTCDRPATRWDGWGRGYVWCDIHSYSADPLIRAAPREG